MQNKFRQLAVARLSHEQAKAALDERVKQFYEQPEIAELKQAVDVAKTELDNADALVRGDLLTLYDADAIGKKGDGYEVKISKVVTVPDAAKALDWCLSHFTPALKLDEKIFKAAVKTGTIPRNLATVEDEPKIYLDADLSCFLVDGG